MKVVRACGPLIIALLLTLPGCGDDGTIPSEGSTGSPVSAGTAPEAAGAPCLRDTVEGCTMAGLRLDPPLSLGGALAVAHDLGGTAIAVYRTDRVCVPEVQFSPVGETAKVASRFAYVDAPGIRERRVAAVDGGLAPPITGWHISESYWNQWEDEWAKAQRSGVQVEGIAVWIAEDLAAGAAADPRVAEVVTLAWRWTDSLDPGYPGELLLDGRAFPGLSRLASPDC